MEDEVSKTRSSVALNSNIKEFGCYPQGPDLVTGESGKSSFTTGSPFLYRV